MKQPSAKRVNTQLLRETLFLSFLPHEPVPVFCIAGIIADVPCYMHAPVRQKRF